MIAALYVDPRGPYVGRPDVDAWHLPRDALDYDGPWPIVAHPPCTGYGQLRASVAADADRDSCAPRAVEQVRRWGGVLEHPRGSRLWPLADLPRPGAAADEHGGYTVSVRQCDWGHKCTKPTWLYVVGVPRDIVVAEIAKRGTGTPTHMIGGSNRGWRGRLGGPRLLASNKRMNILTPEAFAAWLMSLAARVSHA